MLYCLRIKNFALVDQLDLELGIGLNVLTGETGAGKSIILDAIDAVLGGKVNSRMIRTGTHKAILEANFQANLKINAWLEQQEIDLLEDHTVVCSRELAVSGASLRSRCRINGVLVNRKLMTQLREYLVEITAQGQTVQLLIPEMQRELLDLYGGSEIYQQRQIVLAESEKYQQAKQTLEKRRQSEQKRLQRLDLLQYQIKELETANLEQPDELEQLEQERDRLSHVVELQQLSYQAYQLLYQNDSDSPATADLLGKVEHLLADMVQYDAQLETILEIVRGALTQVVEAGYQLNAYGDSLEADPQRLGDVEERIGQLKQICRKYGPNLGDAIAYYQQLQSELDELTDNGESLEELEDKFHKISEQLNLACADLTQLRQQAAKQLEQQLVKQLKPLAMDKVVFECRLSAIAPSATGADQVMYYFSPNPGEPVQPLSIIASGGEMSRFLLALKACFSDAKQGASTLIFDEIDAGVSGKVAQAIADKLHQLSQQHQVLCVTHQPLIAAMADRHFMVDKQVIEPNLPILDLNGDYQSQLLNSETSQERTVVRVTLLDEHHSRRQELAQLTGGNSAQDAIAFADSLLIKANSKRKS